MFEQSKDQNSNEDSTDASESNIDHEISVMIGEEKRNFKAEDIVNLVNQQASATQKTQQVSSVLKACDKFGLDPDTFVSQAEGAFAVISDLITKGYVDEQGNILSKEETKQQMPNFIQNQNSDRSTDTNNFGSEEKITTLLSKALEPFTAKLKAIEQDQSTLTRLRISDSIKGSFNNLEDKDMAQLFSIANSDRSKTLMQHAEEFSKQKDNMHLETKKQVAKELGIDWDQFNANKLLEQDAKGGAGAMFKGKDMSFKKGKGKLTPKQAMMEFMRINK